jgi:predicted ribosomally synthesized peptide with SipW-like signal peptide
MLAIALIVGLVGAATWAYFSDVETSSNNTFTAGTLDLTVDGANDPLPVKFQLGPLAPGESGTIIYELNNVGSLNGWLDIEGVTVLNTEGLAQVLVTTFRAISPPSA